MILHIRAGTAVIDGFVCSECDWLLLSRNPLPYEIDQAFADEASQQFERHACAEFPRSASRTPGRLKLKREL
jgi:hypothetical protein